MGELGSTWIVCHLRCVQSARGSLCTCKQGYKEIPEGTRTFINTPTDTANNVIPSWNARNASNGVRRVLGSPAMNIKSLGDITSSPASMSHLARERGEL